MDFAARYHNDQKVPGKPYSYIVHLSNEAMEILMARGELGALDVELEMQCALLHDVLEDTDCSYSELLSEFGQNVADGVLALTKDKTLEKSKQVDDSLFRIKKHRGCEISRRYSQSAETA